MIEKAIRAGKALVVGAEPERLEGASYSDPDQTATQGIVALERYTLLIGRKRPPRDVGCFHDPQLSQLFNHLLLLAQRLA
jgi:hypothetical protein